MSAAAAVTAGFAMANQVSTANAINNITQTTSQALTAVQRVGAHLASGLLLANQRVDLLQNQVDQLTDMVQLRCVHSTPNLCITPIAYTNDSRFSSNNISRYLTGQWSGELKDLQQEITTYILSINATRVDALTLGDLSSWLASTFLFFKEWVGVFLFGAIICCGGVFSLMAGV